jgi:hypothetical protein
MQPVDDADDSVNPRLRPVRHAAPNSELQPSHGKVAFWVGAGCLTFLGLISICVVLGVSAVWTIVDDHFEEEARNEAAEVARFSDFVAFKPGDPMPTERCAVHQGSLSEQAQRVVGGLFKSLGSKIAGIFGRKK